MNKTKSLFHYLVLRGKEPSSWRGLALMFTALGVTISPEAMGYIIAVGTGISGLIGVLAPDHR